MCPLCKGTKYIDDILGGGTGWRQCRTCSSAFRARFPTDEEVTKFYTEDYRNVERKGYPQSRDFRTHVLRAGRQFAIVMDVIKEGSAYLDIGCALGWAVRVAKFLGMEAYGVEPGDYDRAWSKEHLGLDLYKSIEELPRRDFSLINMSHVLEHIVDPVGYLAELYNAYMAPQGRIVIEVPNVETPSAWSAFHAVVFNTKSLKFTLQEAGFVIDMIRSKDTDPQYPANLIWVVGRAG